METVSVFKFNLQVVGRDVIKIKFLAATFSYHLCIIRFSCLNDNYNIGATYSTNTGSV